MFVCPFVKGSVGLSYVCRWAVFTGELIDCIRGIFSRGSGFSFSKHEHVS